MTSISDMYTLKAMLRKIDLPSITLLFTLGLLGLASFYSIEGMWGVNHLAFLPEAFSYLFWAVVVAILVVLFVPGRLTPGEQSLDSISDFIFNRGPLPRLLIAALFTGAFILLRVETHFLGDGYGWLSMFGSGEGYYHKWAEPGSIFLVRQLQRLMGGYTEHTALLTFQILSIFSGGVVVYNCLSILRRLCGNSHVRIFGLITLLGSGAMLLFCGYVEFYHVLWATATIFINVSLRYLDKDRGIGWIVLSFVAAVLMHMQALYLLSGLLFIVFSKQLTRRSVNFPRWSLLAGFSILAIVGIIAFRWFSTSRIDIETTFLPLLSGRHQSPDYTVFSLKHLSDIANLVFVLFPGILVLMILWLRQRSRVILNPTTVFLMLLSVGSVGFLLTIDPFLGMARDWDLMSLTLLAPVLLLIYQISQGGTQLKGKMIVTYAILCVIITSLFITVATREGPAADRYYSLLRYYGSKDRSGWAIFANYYRDRGDQKRSQELVVEMDGLFPQYRKLRQAYSYLENGDYEDALKLAQELVDEDPYQPDFLQILGNVYGNLGKYELAEHFYTQAIRLKPHHLIMNELGQLYLKQQQYRLALSVLKKAHARAPRELPVTEGLGLVYYRLGHLDSALAIADTLFATDKNSPGGHLLKMVIAITSGENNTAKYHFAQYLKYGSQ
ncbi:MAG: tetratricopeptide repeat protein [bacterium]